MLKIPGKSPDTYIQRWNRLANIISTEDLARLHNYKATRGHQQEKMSNKQLNDRLESLSCVIYYAIFNRKLRLLQTIINAPSRVWTLLLLWGLIPKFVQPFSWNRPACCLVTSGSCAPEFSYRLPLI